MKVGLVLGGGGITGFTYMTAVLRALETTADWDPRDADVIVGTSAGSVVAAHLRGGRSTTESLDQILELPTEPDSMIRLRRIGGREGAQRGLSFLPASPALVVQEAMRGIGLRPARLVSGLLPSGHVGTRDIARGLRVMHGAAWPDSDLWIAAVRLSDGELVMFGRDRSDLTVGTAVQASSAIPGFFHPVEIGGRRYVDGGVHSPVNAESLVDRDLDLIIVIAPMSVDNRSRSWLLPNGALRMVWKRQSDREVRALRSAGHNVLYIEPTHDEARAMGPTLMDPGRVAEVISRTTEETCRALGRTELSGQLNVLRAA